MKNLAGTLFALIFLAFAGLIIASILSPEQQSKAQIAVMNAKREDQARAIEQQYAQSRANIEAEALAKLDLEKRQAVQGIELDKAKTLVEFEKKKQLDLLEVQFQQQLKGLEADFQERMATVHNSIDTTRAQGIMNVLLYGSLGIGGALLAVLVGRGVGNGLTAWARNKGESVWPNAQGQYPAIVRADAVYLPSRMTGAYMVIRRPSALEKIIVAIGHAIAAARGKPIERQESSWVQMPEPSEAQQQVTARDQAAAMLTAATRNGQHSEVANKAVQQVFSGAMVSLESRLPAAQRALSPAELDRITKRLEEQA